MSREGERSDSERRRSASPKKERERSRSPLPPIGARAKKLFWEKVALEKAQSEEEAKATGVEDPPPAGLESGPEQKPEEEIPKCVVCKAKGHVESQCYKKYPHLRPADRPIPEKKRKASAATLTKACKSSDSSGGSWQNWKNKESEGKKDDDWWKEKEKQQNEEWYGGEAWYREEAENQKEYDELMALKLQKEEYDKGWKDSEKEAPAVAAWEEREDRSSSSGWWGGAPSGPSPVELGPAPPAEPPPPKREIDSTIGTPSYEPTRWSSQAQKDDWQFNNYGYLVRSRVVSEGMRVGDVAFTMHSQIKYYITPHKDPESTKVEAEIVESWFDHEYSGVDSGRRTTRAYLAQFERPNEEEAKEERKWLGLTHPWGEEKEEWE